MHAMNTKMYFRYLQAYIITKDYHYQRLFEIFLSLGVLHYWEWGGLQLDLIKIKFQLEN